MKVIYVFLSFMLLKSCTSTEAQQILAPKEFMSRLKMEKSLQLIDVRTEEEFAQGYIPHARNIDYYDPKFKEYIKTLDKGQPVYVYCRSGSRSSDASKILAEAGFSLIYDLKDGIIRWEKENLELVKY